MNVIEKSGVFKVICDESFFGLNELELSYYFYQQTEEDFSEYLQFVQEHFIEMYSAVLQGLFMAYSKNPKWDIWDEVTKTFSRMELRDYKAVHQYIGMPVIEIMRYKEKILTGFSFYQGNRMSVEHGICAVFESCNLLLISDNHFSEILRYWDYHDSFNILKLG